MHDSMGKHLVITKRLSPLSRRASCLICFPNTKQLRSANLHILAQTPSFLNPTFPFGRPHPSANVHPIQIWASTGSQCSFGGNLSAEQGKAFRDSPSSSFLWQWVKGQERKISPKRKFSGRTSRGDPGVIRADIPAKNFSQSGRNPGKTNISARTSMTRRRGRPRP